MKLDDATADGVLRNVLTNSTQTAAEIDTLGALALRVTKAQSADTQGAPLIPEQRRLGERNPARLVVIAHRQGVDAAMEEWQRMKKELPTKGPNSPAA